MQLHKPKKNIWNVALILFIAGVVVAFAPLPLPVFFGGWAFWLLATSAALMLLSTSVLR